MNEARGDRPAPFSCGPGGAQVASMRHSTECALHDMLAQREVALACLSQDRLGRGSDARTAAAALDKGFPLALYWVASRGSTASRWVLISRYVARSCGPN